MSDIDKNANKKIRQTRNMKKGFLARLARAKGSKQIFSKAFDQRARRFIQRFLSLDEYDRENWLASDTYADAEEVSSYPGKVDVRLGIVKEFTRLHRHYIGACRELGVPYKVVDISGPDWIDVIENSGCDAFLVRPSGEITVWKQMYDERFKIMVEELGKIIYPTYDELWMYESKRRIHYWLASNKVPHAKTWVFYDRQEALKFAKQTELPIVYKANFGAGAYGVKIFRKRSRLLRFVNRCFSKGFIIGRDIRDKQWGSVLFQEYLPDIAEWRIIRLGKSYFGHQKLKEGEFHSGSGKVGWYDPPKKLLDFARYVTDTGNFTSMDMDIFETADGRYLVNELQSVFGTVRPYQMLVKGKAGRYLYDYDAKSWHFQEGIFCQNGCCNLRVETLVEMLGHQVELPKVDVDAAVSKEDREASIRDWHLRISQRSE